MTNVTGGLRVRVASKSTEATDICSFELVEVDGRSLPAFSAGSHVDVDVADGITRQYSLCNDPAESHRYQIAVLRDAATRGGSAAMHDRVMVGDLLTISAPKNHFPLAHEAKKSLLLAGGIGITPILCMAERLAAIGADFEMHYCTRSADRTAFRDHILKSGFVDRVHFHFDDGDESQKLKLAPLLESAASDTHLYVCGPGGFLDFVRGCAKDQGWPDTRVHFEYFSAKPVDGHGDTAFDVRLASSGRTVNVPIGCSIVQALASVGVDLPVSCEQGVCGTCLTRVLEGTPDHRDHYLTDAERAINDQMLPCCSRAKCPLLVLDL